MHYNKNVKYKCAKYFGTFTEEDLLMIDVKNLPDYVTEPLTDFSKEENVTAYKAALEKVKATLGTDYPLIIGGERVTTDGKITSYNPANKTQVVGTVSKSTKELAERAMQVADAKFDEWSKTPAEERAAILLRAAEITKERRHEMSAMMTLEAGKPWIEADADTAEAIDFMEYYARQMLELKDGKPVNSRDGEKNTFEYRSLGVGVIISPWNFPFAIMAGTTVAAAVAGNTVLLKPASTTPVIAYKFMEILEEAGLPAGVVNYIPGPGGEVGDYLVDHPRTRFVSFTGSRDVGLRINERASKVNEGQIWIKRVIAEMGGKDTIVVDKEADLDLAAESIVKSAFGFSGQKCSACSRAVIVEDVYDEVLEKVVKLTNDLTIGDPQDFSNFMATVIDEAAFKKITSYFDVAKEEGRIVAGGTADDSTGYFVNPTVVADVAPNARLMQEEIFGPIVAFSKAKDFNEALDIANNTEYGLTGAVISDNEDHIAQAKQDFFVGNLYINRGCTGAIVGYQPFGGYNMSGTCSKAGGPDFIGLHLQSKSISTALR